MEGREMDAFLKICRCVEGGEAPCSWDGNAAWGEGACAQTWQHHGDHKRPVGRSWHRAWALDWEKVPAAWPG